VTIECVPNASEGRRADVVAALARAIDGTPGVRLLDASADPAHHRSVFTFVGPPGAIEAAVLALAARAIDAIDLTTHDGVHPRIGALDVVPFVPLAGASMADAIALARRVGAAIALRFSVPVYLYEEAATREARRRLERIRRGGLPGLRARLQDPDWAPDFGPRSLHPTAGACAVGARKLLVAFNVNLESRDAAVADRIARRIRESGGGLPGLKAMGVPLHDQDCVQVSMNLTDLGRTSMADAFDAVAAEAAREGVALRQSELIGLAPRAAFAGRSPASLGLAGLSEDRILENRLATDD
jgi:glutamate formiminotransferase